MRMHLAIAATAAILTAAVTTPSLAKPPADVPFDDWLSWCVAHGGEIVDQPAGSAIKACCVSDGCIICDEVWANCTWDPAYSQVQGNMLPRPEIDEHQAQPETDSDPSGPITVMPQTAPLHERVE